jgi:hypothetical protein
VLGGYKKNQKIKNVWKIQWKQVSTSSRNSGSHVFKEFLYHARVMHKKGPGNEREDYLSMFRRAQEKDRENFPWILKNLTLNQMEQIQKLGGRSYLLLLEKQWKNDI